MKSSLSCIQECFPSYIRQFLADVLCGWNQAALQSYSVNLILKNLYKKDKDYTKIANVKCHTSEKLHQTWAKKIIINTATSAMDDMLPRIQNLSFLKGIWFEKLLKYLVYYWYAPKNVVDYLRYYTTKIESLVLFVRFLVLFKIGTRVLEHPATAVIPD